MRNVALSDSTYDEAARAAAARGQSVEEVVALAVQSWLDEDGPLVLTPEQIAIVHRAQEDVRAGRYFTSEQVRADVAELQASWTKAHPE